MSTQHAIRPLASLSTDERTPSPSTLAVQELGYPPNTLTPPTKKTTWTETTQPPSQQTSSQTILGLKTSPYTTSRTFRELFTIPMTTPLHPPLPKWYSIVKNSLETWESPAKGGVMLCTEDPLEPRLNEIKADAEALNQSIHCVISYASCLIVSMPYGLSLLL